MNDNNFEPCICNLYAIVDILHIMKWFARFIYLSYIISSYFNICNLYTNLVSLCSHYNNRYTSYICKA